MGIIEIIIVGLVVFGIVKYLNRPQSVHSKHAPSGNTALIVAGVLGLFGLMMIGAMALSYVKMEIPSISENQFTSGVPAPMVALNSYDAVEPVVSAAPASYYSVPWIMTLAPLGIIILGVIAFVRGSKVVRFALVGSLCIVLVASVVGSIGISRTEMQSAHRRQIQAKERDLLAQAAVERSNALDAKPAIVVEQPTPNSEIDINIPIHVLEITYREHGVATSGSQTLPEWAKEPVGTEARDITTQVFSSGRFATLQEAEQSMWPVLQGFVFSHIHEDYPGMLGWQFVSEDLQGVVIKKRCDVTYPLVVGGFTETVYQVHWYLEMDQTAREKLYAMWRPTELNRRLVYLGIGLGTITSVLGVGAFVTRRKEE